VYEQTSDQNRGEPLLATIDLNADLGEGFGVWSMTDDEALLDVVSSANVACGFHAGDASTMRRVAAAAVRRSVRIGAHVSYRDLAGFGRRAMDVDAITVRDEVLYQLGALHAASVAADGRVSFVKPHGALYHAAGSRESIAEAIVEAVRSFDPSLEIVGMPDSVLVNVANAAGSVTRVEGFADREYHRTGRLVSRSEGGIHHASEAVVSQALALATGQAFPSVEGEPVTIAVDTICLHGDSPSAVKSALLVRDSLARAGITVAATFGARPE
jgi:UPF0271 protein